MTVGGWITASPKDIHVLKDRHCTEHLWPQWDEVRNQWKKKRKGKLENSQNCGNETTQSTKGSKKKSQGKFENVLRQMKGKHNISKLLRHSESSAMGRNV